MAVFGEKEIFPFQIAYKINMHLLVQVRFKSRHELYINLPHF